MIPKNCTCKNTHFSDTFKAIFCYFCSQNQSVKTMRKTAILAIFFGIIAIGHSQPRISNLSFHNETDLFDLFEIAFESDYYDNPYDPDVINVYAEFVGPNGQSKTVNGFYFEEYTFMKQQNFEVASAGRSKGWRIRFTPDQTGTWTFNIHAIDRQGETVQSSNGERRFEFLCQPVDAAEGFINKANSRYLKRDVVANGQRSNRSFFPAGPNVAWYEYVESPTRPMGIYFYKDYIDALAGNVNYFRIWLNRYQYLSLYGPEYTQMRDNKPTVYFNSTLNQKDAAELDYIIEYAARNGITLMPCFFTFGDFFNKHQSASKWDNNPFHTLLGLESSTEFFTNSEAKRISRNLIRYIVARWGYATNIVCWELWNEIDNIPSDKLSTRQFHRNLVNWHKEMAEFIRSVDPFGHPITTSTTLLSETDYLSSHIYEPLDIVQYHTYGNIQKAKSNEQRSHQLFENSNIGHKLYPEKLYFVGEFGFGQSSYEPRYQDKDPFGFDTHNCLWSSLFSTAMGPASFWFWSYLSEKELIHIYKPMLTFSKNLPLLSDSFTAHCTASLTRRSTIFPNGIQTYYMINAAEDTLYGWCQDSAYSYQALRRLTEKEGKNGHFDENMVFDKNGYLYTMNANKKPKPCSRNNTVTLPIKRQNIGTQYIVRWYDGETGWEMPAEKTIATVEQDRRGNKFISIEFPSSIRDVKQMKTNNTYGDAVFSLILNNGIQKGSSTQGTASDKKLIIKKKRP